MKMNKVKDIVDILTEEQAIGKAGETDPASGKQWKRWK